MFLPLLRKAAGSSLVKVVTITSCVSDLEFTMKTKMAYLVPYSAAKAAVNMIMAKYAVRFKDENMVFLSISPGMSNTMAKGVSK